ncbi:hypothetical protein PVL29_015104 [Vitis rotundifolia]|uniref:Receptor-like serine/threonine-protein kinase n=1 Tax=Vitis rotundifolia TaxID=103349 RepID=A0AA38ZC18_VITRO|nr:hypothetical protein PVL29_015104 [Vitis rotundifolia]
MGINYVHFLVILFSSYHLVNAQDASYPVSNISSPWINPSDHFRYSPFAPSYVGALDVHYPVANLSSLWVNNLSHYVNSDDKSMLMPILLRTSTRNAGFVCGFYCNYECDGYMFAVLIFPYGNIEALPNDSVVEFPKVVWSANRNNVVGANATLQLTGEGDLILKEANGSVVWSTNTSGESVVGLRLTKTGNLILFDSNNTSVWQSFDHPTDSLIPGQTLVSGQKMIASVSEKNWSEGFISFYATSEGIAACVGTTPPLTYFFRLVGNTGSKNVSFSKRGLFLSSDEPIWEFPTASFARYMKLEPTGQLRFYEWIKNSWRALLIPLQRDVDCLYPMTCGKYGICSNGQCSCPKPADGETSYFRQISYNEPHLGCSEITPLSREASHYHSLLELKETTSFPFAPKCDASTDIESCKRACLKNYSCKAAVFLTAEGNGFCCLPSEIFSLMNIEVYSTSFSSTTFLKVQNVPKIESPPAGTISKISVILLLSLGAFLCLFLAVIACYSLSLGFKDAKEDEKDYLHQVPGMPTRFSHEMLVVATKNFSQELGKGGFGSVFKGILSDGTKVAVKCLDVFCQAKNSFLAEVETIGGIHHMNLVRLVGYCVKKSKRLLVYEYMCNGSLDKWIFDRSSGLALDWQTRRKIILNIARGLAYLHEECQKKIVHLDIKPQNILLDENFNAKVSDFGLSKLIDRDQSQVVTTLRGTLGYLAPEWFSSAITEKVDVYSFGVVTLEILCGRKNLDRSQPEGDMHLLCLFKQRAEEDQLLDLVDKNSEDMQAHGAEVVEMMRLAAWCLQGEVTKRPSMSMVVKVLEGVINVEGNLEYNFFYPAVPIGTEAAGHRENNVIIASPLLPSVLSGPR